MEHQETLMKTVKQIAEQLGVAVETVYRLCRTGKLKHYKVGHGRGAIRITDSDLNDYLLSCRIEREENAHPLPRPRLKHLKI
jgi:excisionase family DNA binding protein